MANFISEDDIELPLVERLGSSSFGYEHVNCYTEDRDALRDGSGRSDKREVVLPERLRGALKALNPVAAR